MINFIHIKNDLKQVFRDPIMSVLLFAPLLIIAIFKLLIVFLFPFIATKFNFDLSLYYQYLMAGILILISGMLGIVIGFMMLDDKDGNIAELMAVTPLGRSGYLVNRLSFSSILCFFYSIIAIYVLNVIDIPFYTILLLSILSGVYSIIIGLLIFSGADDKVKGLTFAKGLNMLGIFAFSDLFALNWFSILSLIFPTYWITRIIESPHSILVYLLGISIHVIWLSYLIYRYLSKK
ncbi:MAG: hypothetical protein Q7262_03990 [Bacteroidales bacterium]|nr:hypothetical protein [Bacteroidales bacterium]